MSEQRRGTDTSSRVAELDKNLKHTSTNAKSELTWRPANGPRFSVGGLAWYDEGGGRFARLPERVQALVRPELWALAQWPASARIRFRTNAHTLSVRVRNRDITFLPHMAVSGSNGLILYGHESGVWRPWGTAIPDPESVSFERMLYTNVTAEFRDFSLYLPLYQAVDELEVGVNKGARIQPPSPFSQTKPVVFYGTSITQGGCASTAGSDFVSTIGRRLNIDTINLGFSGNGFGEPEVACIVSEIDASIFVIDYSANVSARQLKKTLPAFIDILRQSHSDTPILLVTPLALSRMRCRADIARMQEARRDVMFAFYTRARRKGDDNLHVADGFGLIPHGTDAAYVDDLHPTDHGFAMIADGLTPWIDYLLAPPKG